MLDELDDLRDGALAEGLGDPYTEDAGEIDTAGDDLVTHGYVARQRLSRQRHRIEGRATLSDDAVERNFLTRTDDDDIPYPNLFGTDIAVAQMSHVGPDVHQMADALTALALGIALEELAHLEEEHDEDRLGELGLGTRQEADAEGSDSGDGHEEMLVEGIAMGNSLPRLMERLMAY